MDVVRAYGAWESGHAHLVLGSDPPAIVVAALLHYHASINRVRFDLMERDRKKK